MDGRGYAVARAVAPRLHAHFSSHRKLDARHGSVLVDTIPDEAAIEAMIDAAFRASLRREEGYVPKISLAFLTPAETEHPLVFERSLRDGTHVDSDPSVGERRWQASLGRAMDAVAGQDGRFTVFAWPPCIDMVHAHRVETLLL